jgi:hypothetical protein
MKININNQEVNITEQITNISGLLFEPQMVDFDNNADALHFTPTQLYTEISDGNYDLTLSTAKKYLTHGIMEIGIHRNGGRSFTNALLENKPDNIPYVGIDIEDKSYLNNLEKRIYTIRENSQNQDSVRKQLNELGIDKISILFVDGDHSVNGCINDWKYSDLLDDESVVIFHDTNYHPGPRIIIEAINPKDYKVESFFNNEPDYGLAIAYKLKK